MTEPSVRAALGPAIDAVTATLGSPRDVRLSANGLGEGWLNAFRTLQMHEIWRTHGAWITAHKPHFGPGVAERFAASSKVTDRAAAEAGNFRQPRDRADGQPAVRRRSAAAADGARHRPVEEHAPGGA